MINEAVHTSLHLMEQMGALCSTGGIDDETKAEANKVIRRLLKVIDKSVDKLSAGASGIVTPS